MLPIVVVAAAIFRPALVQGTVGMAVGAVGYGSNWLIVAHHPPGMLGHIWSLSIEEQFYVAWPIALVVMLRFRGPRFALGVTITCIVAVLLHRSQMAVAAGSD